MRQIVITLPDEEHWDRDAEYIHTVAHQVQQGYLSGHVDAEKHWEIKR